MITISPKNIHNALKLFAPLLTNEEYIFCVIIYKTVLSTTKTDTTYNKLCGYNYKINDDILV